MKTRDFIQTNYVCVSPYTDIQNTKPLLLKHKAVVVKDNDHFIGLITVKDIIRKHYKATLDYLSPKPSVDLDDPVDNVLEIMNQHNLSTISINNKKDEFIGIIHKRDILDKKDKSTEPYKQFIRGLIHDINNQLSVIKLSAQLLQSQPEQFNYCLNTILQTTGFAAQMAHQFQTFEQIQMGHLKPQESPVDLNELVSKVVNIKKPVAERLDIELKSDISPISFLKSVNPIQIERLTDNLIGNALKFTSKGGKVTLTTYTKGENWILEISDTGIGIPKDKISDLFNPYDTFRRKGLNREPSTGLGLSICKQIVEDYGRTIEVESVEQKGTIFRVIL